MKKTTIIVVLTLLTAITTVSCGEKKLSKKEQEALDGKLMLAGLNGYTKEVKTFVEQGGDVNVIIPSDNKTILHIAVEKGYIEIVKLLVNNDADVNVIDNSNETPLHLAAKQKQIEITKLLLKKGANLNAKNDSNETPLHLAAKQKQIEMAKLLLEKGANPNAKDDLNDTPLHYAASNGNDEMCQLLMAHGADIFITDEYGSHCVFHKACRGGVFWLVEELVKKDIDVNEKCGGWYPIENAIGSMNFKVINLLVENGAIVDIKKYHDEDRQPTPLYNIVDSTVNLEENDNDYLEGIKIIKLLLANGADIYAEWWSDANDGKHHRIIELADKRKNPEIYRILKQAMRKNRGGKS